MRFQQLSLKNLISRLSSSISGRTQPPSSRSRCLVQDTTSQKLLQDQRSQKLLQDQGSQNVTALSSAGIQIKRIFQDILPISRYSTSSSLNSGLSFHKVSIWWDIENCRLPDDPDISIAFIVKVFEHMLQKIGIRGPVEIFAVGHEDQISPCKRLGLYNTPNFRFIRVFSKTKQSADKVLKEEAQKWAKVNHSPAHMMIISTDSDFAELFLKLQDQGYNILLACKICELPYSLGNPATVVWEWEKIKYATGLSGRINREPKNKAFLEWYNGLPKTLFNPLPRPAIDEETLAGFVENLAQQNPNGFKEQALKEKLIKSGYKVAHRQLKHLLSVIGKSLGIETKKGWVTRKN